MVEFVTHGGTRDVKHSLLSVLPRPVLQAILVVLEKVFALLRKKAHSIGFRGYPETTLGETEYLFESERLAPPQRRALVWGSKPKLAREIPRLSRMTQGLSGHR